MTATPFNPAKVLSNRQFKEAVRRIYNCGTVIETNHVKTSMANRGFSTRDIQNIMLTKFIEEAEFDSGFDCCKYRIKGKTLNSEDAVAVTMIMTEDKVVLITVF